ncbi:3-isopropylmalate dehydratase [Methanoregula sp.]|uniref:LeuD/DmdB family oxidoreductase small subunit n=1 Tax=Methanoregula sp. TaxID=2052170 RepID=UPI003C7395DC
MMQKIPEARLTADPVSGTPGKNTGHAVCLPADIDTDVVIAGRYLRTKDRSIWGAHVFEDLDPGLAPRLRGSVIVAGKNFGCGSSREQAAIAIKEAGVVAVIAPSFARIFFRNAINIGLPLIECDITCTDGSSVAFSLAEGWIETSGKRHEIRPLSLRMQEILAAGGLVEYWRNHK